MACYITANKTKMVKLLRDKGYKPTVKRARFDKAFRRRSYWLTWLESDGLYEALLSTAAGKSFLWIRHNREHKAQIHIPLADLQKYEMTEEIDNGK